MKRAGPSVVDNVKFSLSSLKQVLFEGESNTVKDVKANIASITPLNITSIPNIPESATEEKSSNDSSGVSQLRENMISQIESWASENDIDESAQMTEEQKVELFMVLVLDSVLEPSTSSPIHDTKQLIKELSAKAVAVDLALETGEEVSLVEKYGQLVNEAMTTVKKWEGGTEKQVLSVINIIDTMAVFSQVLLELDKDEVDSKSLISLCVSVISDLDTVVTGLKGKREHSYVCKGLEEHLEKLEKDRAIQIKMMALSRLVSFTGSTAILVEALADGVTGGATMVASKVTTGVSKIMEYTYTSQSTQVSHDFAKAFFSKFLKDLQLCQGAGVDQTKDAMRTKILNEYYPKSDRGVSYFEEFAYSLKPKEWPVDFFDQVMKSIIEGKTAKESFDQMKSDHKIQLIKKEDEYFQKPNISQSKGFQTKEEARKGRKAAFIKQYDQIKKSMEDEASFPLEVLDDLYAAGVLKMDLDVLKVFSSTSEQFDFNIDEGVSRGQKREAEKITKKFEKLRRKQDKQVNKQVKSIEKKALKQLLRRKEIR